MPFLVKDLIDEHRKPITVRMDDSLKVAMTRMTEHDYTQLPVVDAENRCLGMVTSDSILRAIKTFTITPDQLQVRDAKTRAAMFREADDLFEMLDDLRDSYAVLIVDEEKHVLGVVTGFDATEYFRRRTEDLMFVEDIELTLRDYIQAAHARSSGEVDEAALQQSIQHAARGPSSNRKRFLAAIQQYLDRSAEPDSGAGARMNPTLATDVFARTFEVDAPRSLESLTFADYVELLLNKEQWPRYASAFQPLTPAALRNMLDAVREIRNALAHFRGDVTPEQQDRLKFCMEWLRAHPVSALRPTPITEADDSPAAGPAPADASLSQPGEAIAEDIEAAADLASLDTVSNPGDNRYAPLATYLRSQPAGRERIKLTFQMVESLLQSPLPPSARQHRAFWSNDSTSHAQSRLWLDAGWRVTSVDMPGEEVSFARSRARQQAYIHFFSALLKDLTAKASFPVGMRSEPDGVNWIGVARIPRGQGVAQLTIAWGRGRQLRVGLYLNGWDVDTRKRVYDILFAERAAIERELDETWNWDRLENRLSAYISVERAYGLDDPEEELALARAWAVETANRFYQIFAPRVTAALRGIQGQ